MSMPWTEGCEKVGFTGRLRFITSLQRAESRANCGTFLLGSHHFSGLITDAVRAKPGSLNAYLTVSNPAINKDLVALLNRPFTFICEKWIMRHFYLCR